MRSTPDTAPGSRQVTRRRRAPTMTTMTTFTFVTVFAFTVWGATGLRAQTLQDGIWTGEMHPSNEDDAFAVSMEVTNGPDGLAIEFTGRGQSVPLPLSDIDLAGDTLTFSMPVGNGIACTLQAQEGGGYAGECTSDRISARLSMVPPED